MKQIWALALLGIGLVLAGCGSDSSTLNGNWMAALTSSSSGGSPNFNFHVSLTDTGSGNLSITNLTFTTANACFSSGATATGGFTLSGNMNGVITGGFLMNIQSAPANGSNQLSLQGTVKNNTITGTWTLSGTTSGCSGSGTFVMNKG